jgi:hypothetical protein
MDAQNIAILVVVSIVCIYAVGSLFYIQKKVGEFASCSKGLTPSV